MLCWFLVLVDPHTIFLIAWSRMALLSCVSTKNAYRVKKLRLAKKSYNLGGLGHLLQTSNLHISDIDLIIANNLTNISALMDETYTIM